MKFRDRYYWRVMIALLRRTGITHQLISDAIGVSTASVSAYGSGYCRPSDPVPLLKLAQEHLQPHLMRLCINPAYEEQSSEES